MPATFLGFSIQLVVRYFGYEPETLSVVVVPGGTTRADVALKTCPNGHCLYKRPRDGANRIHVFAREGTSANPYEHRPLAAIPVRAQQTDGLDVTERALGTAFPRGMLS